MVKTVVALIPTRPDVAKPAARIPYASVDLTVGGHGGLLVLAETSGNLTFWQSSQRETVVLRDGYLASTRGFTRTLDMTEVAHADTRELPPWRRPITKPVHYTLIRTWHSADATVRSARARVRLSCAPGTESVALPLTTLDLQRCDEKLNWSSGATTSATLWRNPADYRIWKVQTVPWPGAPSFNWQVARPWW